MLQRYCFVNRVRGFTTTVSVAGTRGVNNKGHLPLQVENHQLQFFIVKIGQKGLPLYFVFIAMLIVRVYFPMIVVDTNCTSSDDMWDVCLFHNFIHNAIVSKLTHVQYSHQSCMYIPHKVLCSPRGQVVDVLYDPVPDPRPATWGGCGWTG